MAMYKNPQEDFDYVSSELTKKKEAGEYTDEQYRERMRINHIRAGKPVPTEFTETSDPATQADTFLGSEDAYKYGKAIFPRVEERFSKGEEVKTSNMDKAITDVPFDLMSYPGSAITSAVVAPFETDKEGELVERDPWVDVGERHKGGRGFLKEMTEDPVNAFPFGKILGGAKQAPKAVKFLDRVIESGADVLRRGGFEGTTSGLLHETERLSRDEGAEFDAGNVLGESGATIGLGLGMKGAGKAIEAGNFLTPSRIKKSIAGRSDLNQAALDETIDPNRLKEVSEAQARNEGDVSQIGREAHSRVEDIRAERGAQQEATAESILQTNTPAEADVGVQQGLDLASQRQRDKFVKREKEIIGDIQRSNNISEDAEQSIANAYNSKMKVNRATGQYEYDGHPVEDGDAKEFIDQIYDKIVNARGPKDLIQIKRKLVDTALFEKFNDKVKFPQGTRAHNAVRAFRRDLNDAINAEISNYQNVNGGVLSDMWKSANLEHSEAMNALDVVKRKDMLGTQNNTNFTKKIKNLGSERLAELKESTRGNEFLESLWDDISNAYRSEVMARSMNNGGFDIKKFQKQWADMTPREKSVMFDEEEISILTALSQDVIPEKMFSKLGKTDNDMIRTIANIGSNNPSRQNAIRELKMLDVFLGNPQGEGFADEALKMYRAKQLGMTETGELPLLFSSRTGKDKATTGLTLGATTGSAPIMFAAAGADKFSRSPLASYYLYRLADKFDRSGDSWMADVMRKASGLVTEAPKAGVRSQFRYAPEEENQNNIPQMGVQ